MQPEPDVSKAKELRPSVAAIIMNGDGHVLLQRRRTMAFGASPAARSRSGNPCRRPSFERCGRRRG